MQHVIEALRQLVEGADFEPPFSMVAKIKTEDAVRVLPFMPYSLATNVAHTDIWNRQWLAQLEGTPKEKPWPDFPPVAAEEWEAVRDRFLANLDRAYAIARSEPFTHRSRTDESASRALLKIAVHTSYHMGQFTLIKRALRLAGRKSLSH